MEDIQVTNIDNVNNVLKFTLSNVNVSVANSLRRVILSEIPCAVFKTSPYEESKANIEINTCRLNNELIKQRLSCIPIHIKDLTNIDDYILEVDETNDSDTIKIITTEDFKVKHKPTGQYITESEKNKMFPPNDITKCYIDFVRLMPKTTISKGEQLKLTCDFSVSNAKDDCMFNVVSNCSYGFTMDPQVVSEERNKLEMSLKEKNMDEIKISYELKDFDLLKAQRFYKKDDEGQPYSFDFNMETLGIYNNYELIDIACKIIIEKLNIVNDNIKKDISLITKSNVTIANCYDIKLINEDYTIGKIVEYMFYDKYYMNNICSFVGFIKQHPHIDESIIRLGFVKKIKPEKVIELFDDCVNDLIKIYEKINETFEVSKLNYYSIKNLKKSVAPKELLESKEEDKPRKGSYGLGAEE